MVQPKVDEIVKPKQSCRLRGKVLNVERSRLDKMLANNEIVSLIKALGVGIDEHSMYQLRYDRSNNHD